MLTEPLEAPYAWFSQVWQRFILQADCSNLAHALLLAGYDGIGVKDLGFLKARYLLCQAPQSSLPCGRCKSCQLISGPGHPDFTVIEPEEGASSIKIDQIRALVDVIGQTSQLGGAKVILLFLPELMNVNAANALLKNLEEPSENTYFILVTHAVSRVLPTIRSRCVLVRLPVPSPTQSSEWLAAQAIDYDTALLFEAGGAPLKVRDWCSETNTVHRELVINQIERYIMFQADLVSVSKALLTVDFARIIHQLQHWVQNAVRVQLGGQSFSRLDQDFAKCEPKALFFLLDNLAEKRKNLESNANLNVQISIEEILMDIAVCFRVNY